MNKEKLNNVIMDQLQVIFEEYGINDWKFICAALLHDVLEDTYMLSEHFLYSFFSPII